MQLNKTHKRKIVNAIMADIPQIDYKAKVRDYVQAEALKLLPPEILAIYEKPELRRYLQCITISASVDYVGHCGPIFWGREGDDATAYTATLYPTKPHWNSGCGPLTQKLLYNVEDHVRALTRTADEQGKARRSMQDKLTTMLQGIRTLKQAKTLLEADLHKYLPEEPPKDAKPLQASTALVPYVVDNLKAMGWPKDQEPRTEGAA